MHRNRAASSLALALLTATMLTPPQAARAAPGDALGREFQVNSFAIDQQRAPAVAMDADGDFVVAWHSNGQDGSEYGVFAQRYNAAGNPQRPAFQVNSFAAGIQVIPAVAMDADGDFVVAWQSDGQDGDGYGIFAQRYDAAGNPAGGEFQVNSFTTDSQEQPSVAMDADGDFVVAWHNDGQDGSAYGVFAQRYDAAGNPADGEFRVNSFTTGSQKHANVAMDADGDFVVVWRSYGQDGSAYGVFAQRYDAAGNPAGNEFQVNSFTMGNQFGQTVAMDADGDFVVAWQSFLQDGSAYGVFAQRFDAAGNPVGGEVQVNSFTTVNQLAPTVAMDADGDFVVAWMSYGQDGSLWGVFAQRFDAAGSPTGGEFQVNSFTTSGQSSPTVAMDADGDFVVAWHSNGQDGSGYGVFAQRFDGVERVAGDFDGDGNEDILWRNTSTGATVLWLMEGATRLAAQSIGTVPAVWRVAGIGEFNGDGKADILWRNTATGANIVWQMDGFTRVAAVGIGGVPPVWEIETLEDSDGDGLSDIFWRNGSNGATLVWRMRGFEVVATGGTGAVPAVWEVQ